MTDPKFRNINRLQSFKAGENDPTRKVCEKPFEISRSNDYTKGNYLSRKSSKKYSKPFFVFI